MAWTRRARVRAAGPPRACQGTRPAALDAAALDAAALDAAALDAAALDAARLAAARLAAGAAVPPVAAGRAPVAPPPAGGRG